MVEAQHRISTSRLADSLIEEERLEALVEEVKPSLPAAAKELHYLLRTPFRYGFGRASRFRKANERPGIFYASEHPQTCLAEAAYWRLRFFAASPQALLPATTAEYLAFSIAVHAARALDLTEKPFAASQALWTMPDDYSPCQRLAGHARAIGTQLIRYQSVRDPDRRANVALLDPACFTEKVPTPVQAWHLRFQEGALIAIAAAPASEFHVFSFAEFNLQPSKVRLGPRPK
jgi:hypothetical protein